MHSLRHVNITRYITPLREGGSLPALVEADDQFMYVLKFKGAGQGRKALIAELLGGEIARALGLRVPEIVVANLDAAFGRIEGDEEIQDLLKASVGLNLAVHYLSGAVTFDPLATKIEAEQASKIVWLDALLMNVDRTVRNPNMLWWHKELWLIDHGAALYVHHTWHDWQNPERPFPKIQDHVLLRQATQLKKVSSECAALLTTQKLEAIVNLIPEDWLAGDPAFSTTADHRKAYLQIVTSRVAHAEFFVNEALYAQSRF
ncbi:MAG: aminotransferase class I and II [Cyclobacteriaceae bacterium]|nr:aminotransferase class I and II [Cyclobacteriaceae bacterium]